MDYQSAISSMNEMKENDLIKNVKDFLLDRTLNIPKIRSLEEYEKIFHLRHDAIVGLAKLNLKYKEEQNLHDFLIENKIEHNLSKVVLKQTPDIISLLSDRNILIGEVTISSSPQLAFKTKLSKYSYLIHSLKTLGFSVEFQISVYEEHSGDPFINQLQLPAYSKDIILKFNDLLNELKFIYKEYEELRRMDKDSIQDFHKINIPPRATSENFISEADERTLNDIFNLMMEIPYKKNPKTTESKFDFNRLDKFYRKLREEYVSRVPDGKSYKSIFKIPFINLDIEEKYADDKLVEENLNLLQIIMRVKLIKTEERHLFKAIIPEETKLEYAMEGPGAKKYQHSDWYKERKIRQKNFIPDFDEMTHLDFFMLISHLSKIEVKTIEEFEKTNMLCKYLSLMQRLAQEISINSMRKGRKRNFCISSLPIKNGFLVLHPGPVLRASQVNSTIWVRFIFKTKTDFEELNPRYHRIGDWYCSRWLSFTSKKLDHYLRSKDQVLMAYYSHISLSGDILSGVLSDTSNTLSVMTALWAEDSRQTSTILHCFRYFIMRKLSIKSGYDDCIGKLEVPIRSQLLYYLIKKLSKFLNTEVQFVDPTSELKESVENLGSQIISDRAITTGDKINFTQLVNEFYFSNLFNKDEQEPTQDSLQILDKILESESDYQKSKEMGLVDVIGFNRDKLLKIMEADHPGSYSADSIVLGSKLQLISNQNKSKQASTTISSQKPNINKKIFKFASTKSSSVSGTESERVKCLEGVIGLLKEGLQNSFEVAEKYMDKDIEVQIFKKNQIGGVREISILDIVSRIKVNIVETYFRNLCLDDSREMLTKGKMKFNTMRENNKATISKTKFYINGDATRWAQSFHPPQFKYLVSPHDTKLKGYIQHIFEQFSSKKMYIPDTLKKIWEKHPENEGLSEEQYKLKKSYLAGNKHIPNESNMCQGILHYTSSYLHICLMSFIENMLSRLNRRFSLEMTMTSQVSSDDYLITLMTKIRQSTKLTKDLTEDQKKAAIIRIKKLNIIYFHATSIIKYSQRLFNVHDSWKTSITNSVYEFNSCFGVRFTFLSPIIKFAIASTAPINTDSPAKMVSEGVNRVNQIIENGGSIQLAQIAHRFNRDYVESITNLKDRDLPIQVGVYPDPRMTTEIFMFGHQYHDFKLIENYINLPDRNKSIISSILSSQFTDPTEMAANYLSSSDKQFGKIILTTAPSKKWISLIKKLPYSREELNDILVSNPLFLFSNSETIKDQIIKSCLTAYSSGVKESLRNTSASIYYARFSAYKTAVSFVIRDSPKMTYLEAVDQLSRHSILTKDSLIKTLPDYNDMTLINSIEKFPLDDILMKRPIFNSKRQNTLQMRTSMNHLSTSIMNVISNKWLDMNFDLKTLSKIERDWFMMKTSFPFLKDNFEETITTVSNSYNLDREKSVSFILKILNYNLGVVQITRKIFSFGHSTQSVVDSFKQLYYNNYFVDKMIVQEKPLLNLQSFQDALPLLSIYDLFMRYSNVNQLKTFLNISDYSGEALDEFIYKNLESLYYSYDSTFNRRKFLMMVYHLKFINQAEFIKLLSDQKVVMREWIKKQRRNKDNDWSGDCRVLYAFRKTLLEVNYYEESDRFEFFAKRMEGWEFDLGMCFKKLMEDFKIESFDKLKLKCSQGRYMFNPSPVLLFESSSGIKVTERSSLILESFNLEIKVNEDRTNVSMFDDRNELMSVYITIDPIHMNYTINEMRANHRKIYINGFNIIRMMKKNFLLQSFTIKQLKGYEVDFDETKVISSISPNELVLQLLTKFGIEKPSEEKKIVEEAPEIVDLDMGNIIDYLLDVDISDLNFGSLLDENPEENVNDFFSLDTDEMGELLKSLEIAQYEKPSVLFYKEPKRLDSMPYDYYIMEKGLEKTQSIQIYSIFKNEGHKLGFWELNVMIQLANKNLSRTTKGKIDETLTFKELVSEDQIDILD